jgi:hypothetical protein
MSGDAAQLASSARLSADGDGASAVYWRRMYAENPPDPPPFERCRTCAPVRTITACQRVGWLAKEALLGSTRQARRSDPRKACRCAGAQLYPTAGSGVFHKRKSLRCGGSQSTSSLTDPPTSVPSRCALCDPVRVRLPASSRNHQDRTGRLLKRDEVGGSDCSGKQVKPITHNTIRASRQ